MKAIITGGGTGGHIYPALAMAKALQKNNWDILYVGSRGGLEGKLIPAENINYREITVAPLPRKISLSVINALIKTTKGYFQARKIIKEFKADLVLGTGGFVTGPLLLAASFSKIPTIIHEQNVFPGLTNRLLANRVDLIALNFQEAIDYFPKKAQKKCRLTGNPIRKIILETSKKEGLEKLGLKANKKTLLVFGGSQGSKSINQAMIKVLADFKDLDYLQIIHITGEKNYQLVIKGLKDLGIDLNKQKNYKLIPYLKNMEWAYAIADLVVYRAGATGIAEITAKGIAAILIPYPYAAGNHQQYNADILARNGAALVIKDKNLNGEILSKKIKEVLFNEKKLKNMRLNSRKLGQTKAVKNILDLITELNID